MLFLPLCYDPVVCFFHCYISLFFVSSTALYPCCLFPPLLDIPVVCFLHCSISLLFVSSTALYPCCLFLPLCYVPVVCLYSTFCAMFVRFFCLLLPCPCYLFLLNKTFARCPVFISVPSTCYTLLTPPPSGAAEHIESHHPN